MQSEWIDEVDDCDLMHQDAANDVMRCSPVRYMLPALRPAEDRDEH